MNWIFDFDLTARASLIIHRLYVVTVAQFYVYMQNWERDRPGVKLLAISIM